MPPCQCYTYFNIADLLLSVIKAQMKYNFPFQAAVFVHGNGSFDSKEDGDSKFLQIILKQH